MGHADRFWNVLTFSTNERHSDLQKHECKVLKTYHVIVVVISGRDQKHRRCRKLLRTDFAYTKRHSLLEL